MTIQEFLDRYDSVSECFTERELEDLWRDDLLDVNISVVAPEEYGEPGRWTTLVSKVIQIENRYFMIYRERGNTEYQEDHYDIQPDEVKPRQKVITVWEDINIKQPIDYYYESYENKELWTDTEIASIETISHLENQIINYQNFKNKYPVNFNYLCNAAIAVLDLVKTDWDFNQKVKLGIRKVK